MTVKQKLKGQFSALFPMCELWKIGLYYPYFVVFYKDQNGQRRIDMMNYECLGTTELDYHDEGGNIESTNSPRAIALFVGIRLGSYKLRPTNISYKDMSNWVAPLNNGI